MQVERKCVARSGKNYCSGEETAPSLFILELNTPVNNINLLTQ